MNALLFLCLAGFWSGSFVSIKIVVTALPSLLGASLRVLAGLVFLTVIYAATRKTYRIPRPIMGKVWLCGLFIQGFPFALLFWGERLISPGLASIFNGTVPLWTFLLGWATVRSLEAFTFRKFGGLALGFIGLGFIFIPLIQFGRTDRELLGACAVLLMAVSYAIGTLMNRALAMNKDLNFYASLFHQQVSSGLFLLLFSAASDTWPAFNATTFSPSVIWAILYLGIFSTALAWLIYFKLIRDWGAVRASSVTYAVPLLAMFWDYLFFHTVPHLWELVGAGLILSGVILLQFPSKTRSK